MVSDVRVCWYFYLSGISNYPVLAVPPSFLRWSLFSISHYSSLDFWRVSKVFRSVSAVSRLDILSLCRLQWGHDTPIDWKIWLWDVCNIYMKYSCAESTSPCGNLASGRLWVKNSLPTFTRNFLLSSCVIFFGYTSGPYCVTEHFGTTCQTLINPSCHSLTHIGRWCRFSYTYWVHQSRTIPTVVFVVLWHVCAWIQIVPLLRWSTPVCGSEFFWL